MPLYTAGQVLTAAQLNNSVDNSTYVTGTGNSTTSNSYVTLAGLPAVAFTVSNRVRIHYSANLQNNTAGQAAFVSVALSGANTVGSTDVASISYTAPVANYQDQRGSFVEIGGLTPGSTTFTMQIRASGGTATVSNCNLCVQWLA
jgi:hypothetical protein